MMKENNAMEKLMFACDYQEGAHPAIMKKMEETNRIPHTGYGLDEISESAKARIREACGCPEAEVEFLIGGTQTNAVMIDALLQSYQGVVAAESGHVNVHEAGAIEFGGHKVLALPSEAGKISAQQTARMIEDYEQDGNRDHMVMPGMVYISQPTEFGTLYSLQELEQISAVCRSHKIPLYVDGARLAYALGSPENDVQLSDLARLCDAFYIGGTKCGALFGEAVVIPDPELIPHFFTIIKQHGALLAKGWLLGIQFDELFRGGLYQNIGKDAVRYAAQIQKALLQAGFQLYLDSPTNQAFVTADDAQLKALNQFAAYSFWEKVDESHTAIRIATSWSTTQEETDELCRRIAEI